MLNRESLSQAIELLPKNNNITTENLLKLKVLINTCSPAIAKNFVADLSQLKDLQLLTNEELQISIDYWMQYPAKLLQFFQQHHYQQPKHNPEPCTITSMETFQAEPVQVRHEEQVSSAADNVAERKKKLKEADFNKIKEYLPSLILHFINQCEDIEDTIDSVKFKSSEKPSLFTSVRLACAVDRLKCLKDLNLIPITHLHENRLKVGEKDKRDEATKEIDRERLEQERQKQDEEFLSAFHQFKVGKDLFVDLVKQLSDEDISEEDYVDIFVRLLTAIIKAQHAIIQGHHHLLLDQQLPKLIRDDLIPIRAELKKLKETLAAIFHSEVEVDDVFTRTLAEMIANNSKITMQQLPELINARLAQLHTGHEYIVEVSTTAPGFKGKDAGTYSPKPGKSNSSCSLM